MLGGFLGGLANLGTAYGGYLGAQNQYLQNQYHQQALLQAQQQQDALTLLGQGFGQLTNLPTTQPSTTTPGATPTPSPLQPITPQAPAQTPASPLLTTAAGPLGPEVAGGLTGGGPLGTPGLPPMSGFGGGAPSLGQLPSLGGLQPSPAGGPGLPGFGDGTFAPTGAPQQRASLWGVPGATEGLGQYEPLPNYQIAQTDTQAPGLPGPPAGDVFTGVATLGPSQRVPQLQGLGGGQMPSQIPAGPPGIVQPRGGFGLGGYTPFTPQAPAPLQQPTAGTAQAPSPADTSTVEGQITSILKQRGWSDAAIQGALANGMAESHLQPWGETGTAGEQGIWQFNPRGELPGYQQAYGGSRSIADQTNYMAARVEQTMPSYTRIADPKLATDTFMRGFERPFKGATGSRYQFINAAHRQLDNDVDQTGANMIRTGTASGPTVQDSTKTAMLAGRMIDPSQWGRVALTMAVQAIEKANPSAPDAVKALAIMQLYKLLAPEDKTAFQYLMAQNKEAFQFELERMKEVYGAGKEASAEAARAELARQTQAGKEELQKQRLESQRENLRFVQANINARQDKALAARSQPAQQQYKALQDLYNQASAEVRTYVGSRSSTDLANDPAYQALLQNQRDLYERMNQVAGSPTTTMPAQQPAQPPRFAPPSAYDPGGAPLPSAQGF